MAEDPGSYGGGSGTTPTASGPSYIGVPAWWRNQIAFPEFTGGDLPPELWGTSQPTGGISTVSNPPAYATGSDWATISNMASTGSLAGLQQRLINAGVLDPNETWLGHPDDATQNIMNQAMAYANMNGITWQEALDILLGQAAASAGAKGGGGRAAPLLPSPEDVKTLLQDTSHRLIGRNLTEAELQSGVNGFYSTWQANPATYQNPDPSTITDQYLRSSAPAEVQAHQAVSAYGVLSQMLGGIQ